MDPTQGAAAAQERGGARNPSFGNPRREKFYTPFINILNYVQ